METRKHLRLRIVLPVLCTVLVSGLVSGQTWETTYGPHAPQGAKDISIVKISGTQVIWAVPETVKYSADGGDTWEVTSAPRTGQSIIEAHPTNSSFVLTAQQTAIYRTGDQGGQWTKELDDLDLVPYRFGVNPIHPEYWLLGADTVTNFSKSSVRRSVNTGDVWVQVDYFRTTAHPNANDVLYCPNGDSVWIGGSTRPVTETPDMTNENTAQTKTK